LKKIITYISTLLFTFALIPNVNAVQGGTLAVGDTRVVSLIKGINSVWPVCSGSLISTQIVVAAAHCLQNEKMRYASEEYFPQDLWVSVPGSDLYKDSKDTRVKVTKVLLTKGYDSTFDSSVGNYISMKDDIAFFLLEKPLVSNYTIKIATESDITFIKQNRSVITHIGYGMQNPGLSDGKPYLIKLKSFTVGSSKYAPNPAPEVNTVTSEETGDKALCGGDSGSPWYATIDGVEKLVAVTVGASGCGGPNGGRNGTFGTVIYPYLYLVTNYIERLNADKIAIEKAMADLALKEAPVPKVIVVNKPVKCIKKIKAKNIKCYNRSMDGTLEPSK